MDQDILKSQGSFFVHWRSRGDVTKAAESRFLIARPLLLGLYSRLWRSFAKDHLKVVEKTHGSLFKVPFTGKFLVQCLWKPSKHCYRVLFSPSTEDRVKAEKSGIKLWEEWFGEGPQLIRMKDQKFVEDSPKVLGPRRRWLNLGHLLSHHHRVAFGDLFSAEGLKQ